ncbi:hypothetical protein AAJ76_5100012091 [Vairimorpha ceranae]|nr:hypothetical protein AAJ76_5100012091 [Vairimorpha ceranae]KAF5140748.1 hypothetical protein G9O61_00g010680 [Vairimorpha ceranae]KKO74677.1 hypothetical protein AAJ76_5100012091 [Vairimorpha ceranae]
MIIDIYARRRRRRSEGFEIVPRVPKCVPLRDSNNRSSSDSSSSSSTHRRDRRRRNIRPYVEENLQLIQGLLLQVNLNIDKFARWFTEELKHKIIAGIGAINKTISERLRNDINELEKRIIKILCNYSNEIGRELVELISNTNADFQDAVLQLYKKSNASIAKAITDIAEKKMLSKTLVVDTSAAIDLINSGLRDLIGEIERLFRRLTAAEKGIANKIIEDKLHNQLKEIEKLLNEFEKRLESSFKEIGLETAAIVSLNINNSTRRFIGYIDELFKKLGQSIICVLQGNSQELRPPVIVNPSFHHNELFTKD